MKLEPLGKNIIVLPDAATKMIGSLFLPENIEKPSEGEIIAVGPDVKSLKEGDLVLYTKYGGTAYENKEEQEIYLVLTEEDVLCRKNLES